MSFKMVQNTKKLLLATMLVLAGGVTTSFAAEGDAEHWQKRCITSDTSIRTCLVTEAIILENIEQKLRIQLASIRIKSVSNSKRLNMYIQVPNKILLQSGLRFQVDKGKTRVAPFSICYEQACETEIDLSTDFVNQLKKGNEISLYFLQYDGKPVTITVPLVGFTAGFNSKGTDLTPEQVGLVSAPAAPAKTEAPKTDDAPKPLPE